MKTKRIPALFLAAVSFLFCFSACSPVLREDLSVYLTEAPAQKELSEEVKNGVGIKEEFMKIVADNSTFSLHMNMSNAEFIVTDKQAGIKYTSNPTDWNNSPNVEKTVKNRFGSQIVANYYSPENKQGSLTSYFDSFLLAQTEVKRIESGARVNYMLGQVSVKTNYPQIIRKETLDKLISSLSDDKKKSITGRFRLVDSGSATKKIP